MLPNLAPRYRVPLLLLGMLALVAGVTGGLLRLGVPLSNSSRTATAIAGHGALMVTAFFGTVISLERAVALASALWYLSPLFAGLGGLALLAGNSSPAMLAPTLFIMAAAFFCAGSWRVWQRQRALFTLTLGLGALNWLLGNLFWLLGDLPSAVALWMSFLILTIAGERLELTRLRPPQAHAAALFFVTLIAIHTGTALLALLGDARLFATGLFLLALWLLRFDIAWTTVRTRGLPRFVAVCLLAGYVQLMLGASLGIIGGFTLGHPWRDAALHAIFLGFVFSMVIGHAPIIFPAVMRVRIPYHPMLYAPLLLLHTTVIARTTATLCNNFNAQRHAAIGNAVSLALVVLVMLGRVVAGNRELSAASPISSTPPTKDLLP